MWFNRPAYYSYTPYGYGYSSYEDPYARERTARRAEPLHWQQVQDAARSPYNSYLSDDGYDDTFVPYPYDPRAHNYVTQEDLKRQQIFERQRQLELTHQAELNRRREAERARELAEHTSKRHGVGFFSFETSDHRVLIACHPLLSARTDLRPPLYHSHLFTRGVPFRSTQYKPRSAAQISVPATLTKAGDTRSNTRANPRSHDDPGILSKQDGTQTGPYLHC